MEKGLSPGYLLFGAAAPDGGSERLEAQLDQQDQHAGLLEFTPGGWQSRILDWPRVLGPTGPAPNAGAIE